MQQLLTKDFQIIGRLLAFENPSKANELYIGYKSTQKLPLESDFSKIEKFFLQFCYDQEIAPADHRGAQYKRIKVDRQRLFIAVMITIYAPYLYEQVNRSVRVPRGLVKAISQTINQDRSNAGKMIQEVITMERVYDEFRGQAERLVTVLIKA